MKDISRGDKNENISMIFKIIFLTIGLITTKFKFFKCPKIITTVWKSWWLFKSFVANFNPSWDKSSLGNYSWVGRKTTNKTYKSLWIWHKLKRENYLSFKRERTKIKREIYLVGETRNKSCPYWRKGSGLSFTKGRKSKRRCKPWRRRNLREYCILLTVLSYVLA